MIADGDGRDGRTGRGEVSVEGVITEALPRALYRVSIEGSRDVLAHATHDARRNFVRLLVGDHVVVELAPADRTRGRIVRRGRGGRT